MNIKNQLSTAAAGGLQQGSGLRRTLCLLALVAFYAVGAKADVAINATNFPDDNFRSWVRSQDYGADGKLTDAEIAGVTRINVSNKGIANLKGIEYFTALTNLSCAGNQLTTIDLSKNTKLVAITCSGNMINGSGQGVNNFIKNLPTATTSNSGLFFYDSEASTGNWMSTVQVEATRAKGWLPQKKKSGTSFWSDYTGLEIEGTAINATNFPDANFRDWVLARSYGADAVLTAEEITGMTEIDVSRKSIKSLKGIEYFTELTDLDCHDNQLTSLDLSKNTALTELSCYSNQLTSLNVSGCTALKELDCDNNQIRGEGMTALVNSLPDRSATSAADLYVYDHEGSNGNTMTEVQVAAARAKNWMPKLLVGNDWADYEGDIPIDATHFPDKNFRAYIISEVDKDGDGTLNPTEIEDMSYMRVGSKAIYSLKGIEYFWALQYLECQDNYLNSLDFSKNLNMVVVACYNNEIRGDDMNTLVNSLHTSYIDNNWPENLQPRLIVVKNQGNPAYNRITTVQVNRVREKGWLVQYLNGDNYEGENPGIAIDATNFPDEIFRAYVSGNTIDQDGDGYLTDEEIAGVTSINVSGEGIFSLKGIEYFTALKTLKCVLNDLTSLDVSKNTALEELICNDNGLRTLDVTGCTALEFLECHHNGLTTLDVSKNKALRSLDCNQNQLISLDLPESTELTLLVCYINQLTTLDVSNNTALTDLRCNNNKLKSLDLSKNTKLTYLYCYDNQLISLDVSKNTALEWLSCYDNQLTSLNLPETTSLTHLICFNNQLTMLDVSGCTALTSLSCEGNQLTSLDLSKNTALKGLDCYNNLIRGEGMAALVNSLPDRSATSAGSLTVYYNETPMGNMMTEVQVAAAKAKNWIPKQWDDNLNSWVDYDGEEAADGDANGDSILDADDLEIIRNYILGIVPEYIDEDAADVNGDGVVDIVDLTLLIDMMK